MTTDPAMSGSEVQQLRDQGIPEDVIMQLLGLGEHDPTDLARQYTAGGWLRRSATSGDYAKTPYGAIAQGLLGAKAGMMDKDYATQLRDWKTRQGEAKQAIYNLKYGKGKKQITDVPNLYEDEDFAPGEREEKPTGFFYGGS